MVNNDHNNGDSINDEWWLVGGWAYPLWKMMEFISWDDEILNCFWKVNPNSMVPVTTNQIYILPFYNHYQPWLTIIHHH